MHLKHMQRFIFFIFLLSSLLIVSTIAGAADYFVDDRQGNDSLPGTSSENAWKTISKVNQSALKAGDRIWFRRGGSWEETLVVPSSGMPGSPILFSAYGIGPNPRIKCSNTFSSWQLFKDIDGKKIWKGDLQGPKNFIMGAIRNGKRVPRYYPYNVENNPWTLPASYTDMAEGCFLGKRKEFFFRWDQGNPGSMEIGQRIFGIYIKEKRHVIIDGIDVYGPGRYLSWKKTGGAGSRQILIDNSHNITIRNLVLSHHHWGGAAIVKGSSHCTYENVKAFGHRSTGLYFWDAGPGNSAVQCEVHNCGNVASDSGDMGLIGIFKTPDVRIEQCYVHNNGHPGIERIDAAISYVQSPDGFVSRTHVQNAGGTGIQLAENSDRCEVNYSIIDSWCEYGCTLQRNHTLGGIRIGGGGPSTATGICLYNNLFINGGGNGQWAALRILNRPNRSLTVKNNIFHNNKGIYEMFAQSKDNFYGWDFSNNVYFRLTGTAIRFLDREYDPIHIIGDHKFIYALSLKTEKESMAVDPLLNYKHRALKAQSPCIDKGADIGLSVDFNGNVVPFGEGVDIGPFEFQK